MASTNYIADVLKRHLRATAPELADEQLEQFVARLLFNPRAAADMSHLATEYAALIPASEHDLQWIAERKVVLVLDFSEIYAFLHKYNRFVRFGTTVHSLLKEPPSNCEFAITPFTVTEWMNYFRAASESVASLGSSDASGLSRLISRIKVGDDVTDADSRVAELLTKRGMSHRISGPTKEFLSFFNSGVIRRWTNEEQSILNARLPSRFRGYSEDVHAYLRNKRDAKAISDRVDALNGAYVRWLNAEFGKSRVYIMVTRQLLRSWFLSARDDDLRQARHPSELRLFDYARRARGKETLASIARGLSLVKEPLRPLAVAAGEGSSKGFCEEVPQDWVRSSSALRSARTGDVEHFCAVFEQHFSFMQTQYVEDLRRDVVGLQGLIQDRDDFCRAVDEAADTIRQWSSMAVRTLDYGLSHPEMDPGDLGKLRRWLEAIQRV